MNSLGDTLVSYITDCGGALHPAVSVTSSPAAGRSLRTNSALSGGETVLEVPVDRILTEPASTLCLLKHGITHHAGWSVSGRICAALAAVHRCSAPECATCGLFRVYESVLGTAPDTLLHCGPDALVACEPVLRSTPLGLRIADSRRQIRSDCAAVAADLASVGVTAADVMWAHSHYVSRAMRVPVPVPVPAPAGCSAAPAATAAATLPQKRRAIVLFDAVASAAREGASAPALPPPAKRAPIPFGASTTAAAAPSGAASVGLVHAMVPLADFANHRPGALTHFELRARRALPAASGGSPDTSGSSAASDRAPTPVVALVIDRPIAVPATSSADDAFAADGDESTDAGAEVFISYGAKSNAELMAHYGFTLEGNAVDALPVLLVEHDAAVGAASAAAASCACGDGSACSRLRRLRLAVAPDFSADARLLIDIGESAATTSSSDSETCAAAAPGADCADARVAAPSPSPRYLLTQHTPCTELLERVAERCGLTSQTAQLDAGEDEHHSSLHWRAALRAAVEADAASAASTFVGTGAGAVAAKSRRDPMVENFQRRCTLQMRPEALASSSSTGTPSSAATVSGAAAHASGTSGTSSGCFAAVDGGGEAVVEWTVHQLRRLQGQLGQHRAATAVVASADVELSGASSSADASAAAAIGRAEGCSSAAGAGSSEAAASASDSIARANTIAHLQAMARTYRAGLLAAVNAQLRFLGSAV